VALSAQSLSAAGVYEDYNRFTSFLAAPQEFSLEGWASRVDASETKAAVYTAGGSLPFKSLLFRLEFPYVSRISPTDIRNDFGDPRFRLRLRAWSGATRALYVLSGVRMGASPFLSPDVNLYPYATGSVDIGLGVAYVDTVASVTWWTSASATHATRIDDTLSVSGSYGDYAEATAGIAVSVTERIRVQIGVVGSFPKGASSRQIYIGSVDAIYSGVVTFFVSAQMEGGPTADRVFDHSIGVGTRMRF
jgi:hypothetical protein